MVKLRGLNLALLFVLALNSGGTAKAQDTQGKILQIAVARVQATSARALFRVELHNAGDHDLILNLGMMLSNGRNQYPDAIHLILTEPGSKTLELELKGPGIIGGRVDPMVVPLPVGATFGIRVDLQDYGAPKQKVWSVDLSPGRYTLRVEYTGKAVSRMGANIDMQGIALMPYWTGTVWSEPLSFTVTRAAGSGPQ